MVAAWGIPARHSKGMLLALHDSRACREHTVRTWMHRLSDEGMQKCMDGLAEDESSKRSASRGSGQTLGQEEGTRTHVFCNHVLIITNLKSANIPHLQFQKSPRSQCPKWRRISCSLHQLVTSVQPLKMQITASNSIYAFNYWYTPKERFVNIKTTRESVFIEPQ